MADTKNNSVEFRGTLHTTPTLKVSETGTPYIQEIIAIERADDSGQIDYIPFTAKNELAKQIIEKIKIHKGDGIHITGELRTKGYEEEGTPTDFTVMIDFFSKVYWEEPEDLKDEDLFDFLFTSSDFDDEDLPFPPNK